MKTIFNQIEKQVVIISNPVYFPGLRAVKKITV